MTTTKIQANEIHAKWSKLNQADLANVRSHDALSALVAKAYSMDKARADADVTVWMASEVATSARATSVHWRSLNRHEFQRLLHLVRPDDGLSGLLVNVVQHQFASPHARPCATAPGTFVRPEPACVN